MKKTIIALIIIVLIALFPFVRLDSIQDKYQPVKETSDFEIRRDAVSIFAKGLSYKTISQVPQMIDSVAFEGLFVHLQRSFPLVYSALSIDTLSTHLMDEIRGFLHSSG